MYFPPSSWGKLGPRQEDLGTYLDNVSYQPYKHTDEIVEMAKNFLFNDTKTKTSLDYMKEILEGLKMPVLNPKTGEQDYVDISLVSKIVIDPEYVEDMKTNDKIKINITLQGEEENKQIFVIAQNEKFGKQLHVLSIQKFEEMLSKAIHEEKDQRLEAVKEFEEIVAELVTKFVNENRVKQSYLSRVGLTYVLDNGVGIIRDIKTDQDVGVFESFSYLYDRTSYSAQAKGITLSGRTFEDLKEEDRFEFAFYSIEHGTVYSVIGNNQSRIDSSEESDRVKIERFDLVVDLFDKDHKHFNMIQNAQSQKEEILGIDKKHPLYDTKMSAFRESRLSILEESKQKLKQEKLINQFADIDFG